MGSSGTPLDLVDAEATPSSEYSLISTSTRTSTLSPFSGSSLGSQPLQPTSASTTSFFDEAIELPLDPPVDSAMPDLDVGQVETELSDALRSTPSDASSKPAEPRARATKDKGHTKTTTRKGTTKDKRTLSERPEATAQQNVAKPKPRKRGRPKNNITEADLADYPQDELAEDGLPKDPRRRRVLERNRIAATKCRNRKRDEAKDLALQEQEAENHHRYLSSVCDSLTAQIYNLKTQLLCHSDCGCQLIQTYIAHEAKRSVDTMVGVPPSNRESDYHASVVASSSDSMHTSPEAEGTPVWTNSFPNMPTVTAPTSTRFDAGFNNNFPMVPMSADQAAAPHHAGLSVSALEMNRNDMVVLTAHQATHMMHPPPQETGYWNPWETQ